MHFRSFLVRAGTACPYQLWARCDLFEIKQQQNWANSWLVNFGSLSMHTSVGMPYHANIDLSSITEVADKLYRGCTTSGKLGMS